MAVIANHPESRFPRAGVTVFRHGYLPPLTGIGHELAREIEAISRSDPDRQPGSSAYGEMRVAGGEIEAGILLAAVPRAHRVTAGEETWFITYADGWVAAELHDSWESAISVYGPHARRLAPEGPGAFVIERQGYWLAAHWLTNELEWHRPDANDRVPYGVHVWTDQLDDDPGIRVWADAQAEPGRQICGLIAPELMYDTLVGYPQLAQQRGVSEAAVRSRVSYGQAAPTFPDAGALWSRPAARTRIGLKPEPAKYDIEVVRVYGSETKYHYVTGKYADDLTEQEALEILAKLRAEAEAYGLAVEADRDLRWHVNGAEAVEACFQHGWLAEAKAVQRPPTYVWPDPTPVEGLPAPTKRGRPAKTRKQPRRGSLA